MIQKLENSWKNELSPEFEKEYFKSLTAFVRDEYLYKKVYPAPENLFRAFESTPFDAVRVVILGQDPYHGPGQAHGLCFSVPRGVANPPSLKNIFKEIETDQEIKMSGSGDLSPWTKQGVFLLNATLSVLANQAGSHQHKGWETFTDAVIKTLSEKKAGLVFLLWGSYAQSKEYLIDSRKHLVLKSPHPSPLSAYRGFFGCKHFSKTNTYLQKKNQVKITWSI